jgi:chain length determinant protein EpsF
MSAGQFLLVLRARWKAAFGTLAIALAIAVALSFVLPKKYTAFSSVVVDVKGDPVAGTAYPAQVTTSMMSTQIDIVQSARVAQRVVKTLKLDQDAEFRRKWQDHTEGRGDITAWIADLLEDHLTVTPSHESNVINIAFTWPDAKVAAALANAFAEADIATNIELKVEPAREYAAWFDQRSVALRADLEAKQKRLSDYQREKGIVATDEKLDIEGARLTELSSQLVQIQALRQDSQSRQRQSSGDNETLPEVLQSLQINSLKTSLAQAEAKLQDIAANLGKNHPDYKTTLSEVESLRTRISEESANIAASLGSTTQVNVRRENEIKAALEAQKQRVLDLRHQHDESANLENDVLTAQRNLDAVTQRLAQSNLESQTQQTNIMPLTIATEPVKPSSPKLLRNIIIAIFFGGVLGGLNVLLRERLDPRIRSEDDVMLMFDIPLLGTVGSTKSIAKSKQLPPAAEPYAI